MWCLLWPDWLGMVAFQKEGGCVCVHGKVAGAFGVVPREINASKFFPNQSVVKV